MPPPRKPESERVRRNKQPESQYVPDRPREVVPAVPYEWVAKFFEYVNAGPMWDRLWRDPVAHFWRDADRDAVALLVVLLAEVQAGALEDDKVLGRVIRLQTDLGLTPAGRRQQRWLFAEESSGSAAPRKARTLKVVGE